MNRRTMIATLLALAAHPAMAQTPAPQTASPVVVETPWARASVGNSRIAVAYMTLRNGGAAPDRLLSVASPVGRAELHTMTMDNNVMRMRPVEAVDIPAGGSAMLQPSGLHIMLLDLHEPLRAGTEVPLTLRFERAGTVTVSVPVAPANATRAPAATAAPAAPTSMPMQMPSH
jgi:copper(I)-binding protein